MAEGINKTSITLPSSVSTEIWAKTLENSAIMQLAQRIDLPGNGLTIPVITGEPAADWVTETENKPVSQHTLSTKEMKGYTLAIIEPFSNQFRDNTEALYNELVSRLPFAIAKKFDETVMFGTAPGTGFDTLNGVTNAVDASTKTYDAFVDAIGKVAENDSDLSAFVLSPQAKTLLLKTKDTTNRPLFINNVQTDGAVGHVLSVPTYFTKSAHKAAVSSGDKAAEVLGFGGDWSAARYGVVKDVNISISDQATLTSGSKTLNLWQRNMFAVRCEFEVGFVIRDVKDFVRIDNGTASA